MSTLAMILQDEISTATLQKGLYAIAACTLIGAAAYAGYKAAEPEAKHLPSHRHPESNEQVRRNIRKRPFNCLFDILIKGDNMSVPFLLYVITMYSKYNRPLKTDDSSPNNIFTICVEHFQ